MIGADLGGAKVAELELVGLGVDEQVLRLDVAVAHTHGVDVGEGTAHLEHVQLHKQHRHALPALTVVLANAENGLRDKLQHQVEVHLPACIGTVVMPAKLVRQGLFIGLTR